MLEPTDEPVVIPALLRAARGSYRRAIQLALAERGFDDVPRNGAFVISAVGNHGAPLADAVAGLGVSKQAASQLVDTLVLRGYVERSPDPNDRRRMNVTLTERGVGAADVIRDARISVDERLAAEISETEMRGLRAGLEALARIAHEHD